MNILELYQRFHRYCAIEEGLALNTLKDLKSKIGAFVRRTGAVEISEVSLDLVQTFFYEGHDRYQWSYSTYANYHKYLKKFFAWCVEREHMKKNPIQEIKKPKRPHRLPRRLKEEDIQKILYTTFSINYRYGFEQTRNYAIMATYVYTGLRRTELIKLQLTDIDLENSTILVRQAKGNKDRVVPIHYKLKPILERYLSERKKSRKESLNLFVGARGSNPLTESGIKGIYKKIRKASGVHFTPHQLRHTFASVAVEQDLALPKVQQILGHSSLQSTMIYLKMSSKALSQGLNAVELF